MIRLVLLSLAGSMIFLGFGLPFIITGFSGLITGFFVIVTGAAALWFVETRTGTHLNEDSAWNRLMKTDGDNLVGREDSDQGT